MRTRAWITNPALLVVMEENINNTVLKLHVCAASALWICPICAAGVPGPRVQSQDRSLRRPAGRICQEVRQSVLITFCAVLPIVICSLLPCYKIQPRLLLALAGGWEAPCRLASSTPALPHERQPAAGIN